MTRTAEVRPKILYPAPDTVIALDPDIPEDRQRVFIAAAPGDPSMQLVLDETPIGQAPSVSWAPIQGKHRLSLINKDGATEDQISFEVK